MIIIFITFSLSCYNYYYYYYLSLINRSRSHLIKYALSTIEPYQDRILQKIIMIMNFINYFVKHSINLYIIQSINIIECLNL